MVVSLLLVRAFVAIPEGRRRWCDGALSTLLTYLPIGVFGDGRRGVGRQEADRDQIVGVLVICRLAVVPRDVQDAEHKL